MDLSTIKSETVWNEAAESINDNFNKVGTEIDRLGRGGSFSCSSPENDHANLYIGSVANQNVTDEMVKEINAKGWNVYVDNIIRQVN